MTSRDEDEAWRAIVENYGERARLDEAPADPPVVPSEPMPAPGRPFEDLDVAADLGADEADLDASDDVEPFVPAEPDPLPVPPPGRRAAWVALVAGPLLLVLLAVSGWTPPVWLTLLLVAGFVGGFGYLVATMPSDPRDPWDDGSRV